MDTEQLKRIEKIKNTIDNFNTGYLEMNLGYKFRTKQFLDIIFLYTNSVDVKNPDILGKTNRNTFVYEVQSAIRKIKQQVRLDIKDLNFTINGASTLARFIPRSANRKILKDNNFSEIMDEVPDNAVDFGSGFLKVWEVNGKLKIRSIDPYAITFNQYNFKDGLKIEKIRKTIREVLLDEKYDAVAKSILEKKTKQDELDNDIILHQSVQDFTDGTQQISVVNLDYELEFYNYKTKKGEEKIIKYYKYDLEKRKGFPDALGVGCNERVFNKLVQSKVNRERMDKVMEIASKLPFQKQIDNERDNMVGKEVIKLETSAIIGHKGNPITPLDTGGVKQISLIRQNLNEIIQTIGTDLNVGEALQGNTLPSGTSGVLGNLLTENSASVLKEYQKNYAKFLDWVYSDSIIPYMLGLFNSDEDMRKYLTPNDVKLVERSVKNYLIAQKYIDSVIAGEEFNQVIAEAQVKEEMSKRKPIIAGELLNQLREEMKGIETYISGENVSKAQIVGFIRELQARYTANPQIFNDPFILELIKKEAEYDAGMSGLEIDALIETIPEMQASQLTIKT